MLIQLGMLCLIIQEKTEFVNYDYYDEQKNKNYCIIIGSSLLIAV